MKTAIIKETTALAFEGKITFPAVVGKLIEIGVERYLADLAALKKSFYFKEGSIETIDVPLMNAPDIAEDFDASGVQAAIKLSQGGQIIYPQFLEIVMRAGCSHYEAFITGKQVIYFGRKGDFHIEKFPQK